MPVSNCSVFLGDVNGDGKLDLIEGNYGKNRLYLNAPAAPPTVTTQPVSNIGATTATGNRNITDFGSSNPTAHGFVWDTNPNPTTSLTTKIDKGAATQTGEFTAKITGLTPGTKYFVRAYVTNEITTAYGDDKEFTTPSSLRLVCHSTIGVSGKAEVDTAEVDVEYHSGNAKKIKGCEIKVTYDASIVKYAGKKNEHANLKMQMYTMTSEEQSRLTGSLAPSSGRAKFSPYKADYFRCRLRKDC